MPVPRIASPTTPITRTALPGVLQGTPRIRPSPRLWCAPFAFTLAVKNARQVSATTGKCRFEQKARTPSAAQLSSLSLRNGKNRLLFRLVSADAPPSSRMIGTSAATPASPAMSGWMAQRGQSPLGASRNLESAEVS